MLRSARCERSPTRMLDEAERLLLDRARAGEAQAIEELLERHQEQVFRFAMKMCGEPEDAKDVLEDTLGSSHHV